MVADGKEPGSVRAKTPRDREGVVDDLRPALERLDGLPIRPASARLGWSAASGADGDTSAPPAAPAPSPGPARPASPWLIDPGWALERSRSGAPDFDPMGPIAARPWWPAPPAGAAGEAMTRLWRWSVAVSLAARKLAVEANDPDPDAVARAGLLHQLGLWAVAAVDPAWVASWFALRDPAARRALERRSLGCDAADLGRHLAARWGAEPLVEDAAWLHADLAGDLADGLDDDASRRRVGWIQQAAERARRTPWAPGDGTARDPGSAEARTRILVAEVQARCGGAWVDPDASAREERLTRDNARLRIANRELVAGRDARDRFLRTLAESTPTESPEAWADRAGLAWCEEPGVAAARVDWSPPSPAGPDADPDAVRPPSAILPLGGPRRPSAEVRLWRVDSGEGEAPPPHRHPARAAWDAWSRQVEERTRLRLRLDRASAALRARAENESDARRLALVEGLAEFAAGAGHELNNPLAVILGRAQLVLGRVDDADSRRSLQAIIAQAQKAHRILRDLMYVARPPEARPRACLPDEIVRACVRDLQPEAEARGVTLTAEGREPGPRVWVDPDLVRHLADILVRNALEATPSGGSVQFLAGSEGANLRWTVRDTGRGIAADEGARMFDPFFCGRQAGRGLGLGLPRAARIVDRAGGDLRWQSTPGLGTSFQVTYPAATTPPETADDLPPAPRARPASPAN